MNNEQKTALINSQIAMFYAEKSIMDAENTAREEQGYSPANGPKQYTDLYEKYLPVLGYNAVIGYLRD
jgi:hypothetical protein